MANDKELGYPLPVPGSSWRMKHAQSYGREKRHCLVLSAYYTDRGFGRVYNVANKRSTMKLRTFLRDYEKTHDPTPNALEQVALYTGTYKDEDT